MKFSSVFKLILRIISLPLVFCLFLVLHNLHVIRKTILFFRYGGEFIHYDKDDSVTIKNLYTEMIKRDESRNSNTVEKN